MVCVVVLGGVVAGERPGGGLAVVAAGEDLHDE